MKKPDHPRVPQPPPDEPDPYRQTCDLCGAKTSEKGVYACDPCSARYDRERLGNLGHSGDLVGREFWPDFVRRIKEQEFWKRQNAELAAGTELLMAEITKLKAELARVANENAALVAQLPHGFTFPRDGECKLIE